MACHHDAEQGGQVGDGAVYCAGAAGDVAADGLVRQWLAARFVAIDDRVAEVRAMGFQGAAQFARQRAAAGLVQAADLA